MRNLFFNKSKLGMKIAFQESSGFTPIASIGKAEYTAVRFIEDGKEIKKRELPHTVGVKAKESAFGQPTKKHQPGPNFSPEHNRIYTTHALFLIYPQAKLGYNFADNAP